MSVSGENTGETTVEVEVEEPEQFRKLFIGGLNYTTTNDSLKEFFEKWGDIVDVVVMKDPVTKRSRGFGFITYSKSSMVDDAMANRPHKIDGREVETKRAVPRDDIDKPDIAWTVKKMFVSGIKEQTEEDLKEYFGQYGNILNIQIITDKETGQRKGFGFIEFDDSDSVDKAVLIKSHEVSGSKLEVKKAVSKDVASASRGRRGGRGASSGRGQSWGGPNNNWGGNHFGGYGSGNSGGGWAQGGPQGWNNVWGSQASQGGWGNGGGNWGGSQSGYGGGPMRGNFGNNRAVPYHTGRGGSGNFHQNSRGRY
ncbi:heterogeneous nuclear ribonucleoprotein 87F-like [Aphis gossypii]|uniref:heterogeneous nuclear ribonucleoprotein 87F-like n=1 Tax=Aphis gossypii TaxID=80765 RepID=UPI00100E5021|nr:heterogeneous nuclear ribonucleoprotein 87F-like [Aphis gossypii]XP_027843050.1 heterogeneous nuclear ribonucleoprotein 87F-like [Aphis gossypii]XP_050054381.1 heterogeneous nuclear ribonucleoprotein 87F-like [Aphis gossypii]XP_050054382.1 heterogeneous nuclear ribonucleoprotein 87F-like [Aphis gossypii]